MIKAKKTARQKAATGAKKKVPVKPAPVFKKNNTAVKTAKTGRRQSGKTAAFFPSGSSKRLFIAGIGASAGGLKALEAFFDNMPFPCGIAFVVIQHLSSDHKSIMGSLLEKHTKMKVLAAEDGINVKPDCIYLNPPDKNISISRGTLKLMEPGDVHALNLPIDFFFRALAEDQKEQAGCIVLSGTGSDGTLGLKAVKARGGMTMAQQEDDAEYGGMPRSAMNTGLVDYVLPATGMGAELLKYVRHPYLREPREAVEIEKNHEEYIRKIFMLIRAKTGHDFSHYKKSTVHRRIERRMAVHQINRIADYVRLLNENQAEVEALFRDMLITVTNFFRDPDAFTILQTRVLPDLIRQKPQGASFRLWVTGCATGEEAYSVAMLIAETMDTLTRHLSVQIFATDIDEEAIDYARKAVYPESIAADVSPGRLKNFFIKEEKTFRLKKQIREMVVFANQSLTRDPPFSKLDMVVCRNVLIYLDSELQKKIFPLFHYTLNPGGILFLGSAESIGSFSDFFTPVDAKWKIFMRKNVVTPRAIDLAPPAVAAAADTRRKTATLTELDIRDIAEMVILEKYSPSCVLVNDAYEIIYFSGNTDKYLSPPVGVPNFNILKMANEGLLYSLSTALHKAAKQKTTVVCKGLQIQQNNAALLVDVTVMPIAAPRAREGLLMVVFEDRTALEPAPAKAKARATGKENTRIAALQQELRSTKEYLQTTIEALETTNEELKSANEELQSTNEELQSANEELETSGEEMQSTNEELATVNAELQTRVDELSCANNDLNNLLASTEIGTIFLDLHLRIKRFTPSVAKIFNLIKTDIGRPISDLTAKTTRENIYADCGKVLTTLNTIEKTIRVESGEFFGMRILPYRTTENVIDGVVLTFTDITGIVQARENARLAAVVKDSNDAITLQNRDGAILAWNRGASRMYGYTEAEALAMGIGSIVPDNRKTEYFKLLKDVFAGREIDSFKTSRLTKDGRVLDIWLTVTVLKDALGRPETMATTERDITVLEKQG